MTVTIQKTSKKYKLARAIGILFVIIGSVGLFTMVFSGGEPGWFSWSSLGAGLALFIYSINYVPN
jgi:hypothetical protein